MKKLKQAFGKEDAKKGKNFNMSSTIVGPKKLKLNDTGSFYLYKSPGKTSVAENDLGHFISGIIDSSFRNNSFPTIDRIVEEIIEKCEQSQKYNSIFKSKTRLNKTYENEELEKLQQIKQIVEQILEKNSQEQNINETLQKFNQQLGTVIKNKNKITKKEKLQQYDRLIRMLSPRRFGKTDKHFQQPMSPNNVKIKVTKQEFQIKRQSSYDCGNRIGSEGKRVKTAGNSHSNMKSENGHQKLRKLMQKSPSLKIIKTKVEYDYSAILDASKSKIQTRSKNITANDKKSGNDITTKLNKAKKNEGFVFYRPKTGYRPE